MYELEHTAMFITVLLIILRGTNIIQWKWWKVFIPLYITLGLYFLSYLSNPYYVYLGMTFSEVFSVLWTAFWKMVLFSWGTFLVLLIPVYLIHRKRNH